jgi:hypothetical protein
MLKKISLKFAINPTAFATKQLPKAKESSA